MPWNGIEDRATGGDIIGSLFIRRRVRGAKFGRADFSLLLLLKGVKNIFVTYGVVQLNGCGLDELWRRVDR